MNANEIRDDVTLPGGTAVIRMLSFKQIKEARSVSAKEGAAMMAGLSGDVLEAIKALDDADGGTDAPVDPLQGLDLETVLRYGVIEVKTAGADEPWYEADGTNADKVIDGLGEDAADALGKAVASLSQRTGAEGNA